MSKKHIILIFFTIAIFLLSGSLEIYAIPSTPLYSTDGSGGGGGVPSTNKLVNNLDIHLGEDGLIKLTKEKTDNMAAWRVLIREYRKFVVGFAGFGAVTMVLLFIKHFVKLGAVAGNPQARSEAIKGLWVTGVATALLGSVAIVTALFYTSLK